MQVDRYRNNVTNDKMMNLEPIPRGIISEPPESELDSSFLLYDIDFQPVDKNLVVKESENPWPDFLYPKWYWGDRISDWWRVFPNKRTKLLIQEKLAMLDLRKDHQSWAAILRRWSGYSTEKRVELFAGKSVNFPQDSQILIEARNTAKINHPNIATVYDLAATKKSGGITETNIYDYGMVGWS